MEKIIVLTGGSEHHEKLIDCLKDLFSDCEIEIQTRESMDGKYRNPGISTVPKDNTYSEEKLNKLMSFL